MILMLKVKQRENEREKIRKLRSGTRKMRGVDNHGRRRPGITRMKDIRMMKERTRIPSAALWQQMKT